MEIKETTIKKHSPRLVEVESKTQAQSTLPTVSKSDESPPATPFLPTSNSSLLVRRFFAWMTDSVIISFLALVVETIMVLAIFQANNSYLPNYSDLFSYDALATYVLIWLLTTLYNFVPLPFLFLTSVFIQRTPAPVQALLFFFPFLLAASITQFFYYVRFNSSSLGVSPGKFIFGLKTEGPAGETLTSKQVISRELVKQVCTSFLGIPLLLSLLYPPAGKQLLHDAIANTRVHDNSKTGVKKTSHKLAPFAAITSSLLIGFTLYQLAAPQLHELSLAPKLQAYRLMFGENSAAYKDLLWNDIEVLVFRFSDKSLRYQGQHLSKAQLTRLEAEIKWLERHENKTDKRFRDTYLNVISYFDNAKELIEQSTYMMKYLELAEETHDATLFSSSFNCTDGETRNAYGALADRLIERGESLENKSKAKDCFKQALALAERGIEMTRDKSYEEQMDALVMRRRAARLLGDSLLIRESLKQLTDLERKLFFKTLDKGTNPSTIYGVGSVYEMFNDLMTLSSLQESAGDLNDLKITVFHLQDIFKRAGHLQGQTRDRWQRVSPDEKSQLKHLAALFPEYAKTLLEMTGEK